MTTLGVIIVCLAGGLTLVEWMVAMATWIRRRVALRQWREERGFTPCCAVIIPTKGGDGNLERNLRAHLRMDYPDFHLILAVESADDEGVPVIRKLMEEDGRVKLIVAGLATTCSQQNHNMIAGVMAAGDVEVLAFADNDYAPAKDWLRDMVNPLSSSRVTVSSGYRWVVAPEKAGAGASVHVAVNMMMYAHFSVVNLMLGRALWGGAFALRRQDYLALKVEDRWRVSVSDDMTLSAALVEHGRRSHLVARVLVESEGIARPREARAWYGRQLTIVRAYDYGTWIGLMAPGYLGTGLVMLWPLVACFLATGLGGTWWQWGGVAGLIFVAGEMVTALILTSCGQTRRRWVQVVGAPVWRLFEIAAWLGSAGRRAITWAGVDYQMDRRGKVIGLERDTSMK